MDFHELRLGSTALLTPGLPYDVGRLTLIGWLGGTGTALADYFDPAGLYRGADLNGIEPVVTTASAHTACLTHA